MKINYEKVLEAFVSDGALRDFYIQNVSPNEWNKMIEMIKKEGLIYKFKRNVFQDEECELPSDFFQIYKIHETGSPILKIDFSGAFLACHFFCENEIEFDFWPEEFDKIEKIDILFSFFQKLVNVLKTPGILTFENMKELIIEEFKPYFQNF